MNKLKSFIMTTVLGGVTVILPAAILTAVLVFLFGFVFDLISPLTDIVVAKSEMKETVASILTLACILLACFFIGLVVRTNFGKVIVAVVENRLLKAAPGYNLIKETVMQIMGKEKQPFSSVALAQIFGNETLVTCFVTDEHQDGSYSVFVPTGPNPTSGNIYHLKQEFVHIVDVPTEDAMRSIISCGAGSTQLIEKYQSKIKG